MQSGPFSSISTPDVHAPVGEISHVLPSQETLPPAPVLSNDAIESTEAGVAQFSGGPSEPANVTPPYPAPRDARNAIHAAT
jgi:hypothetical protein